MLRRIDDVIVLVTGATMVALVLVMTGATLAGVFMRYALNDALTWSEEVARYSMIWLSFLGGGLVFRRGGHIAIEFLVEKLPHGLARHAVMALAQLVAIAFLVVLVWQGQAVMARGAFMTTPALRMPMSVPYSAIPLGAMLMIYHLVAANIIALSRKESRDAEDKIDVTVA